MKACFLDFDGTVNGLETNEDPSPVHQHLHLDPVLIGRVNQICERAGAVVVLSTSWRRPHHHDGAAATCLSMEQLREALRIAGLRADVVGATPDLARQDSITRDGETTVLWRAPERRREIAAWVEQHKPTAYVILDDDRGAEIAGHFVWCDPRRGLSVEGVETAVRILEGR